MSAAKILLALACALSGAPLAAADNFAVLVAGSSGYSNYRHHADVCHAQRILVAGGVARSNIITMLFDDVAQDPENPFPNQLFNWPTQAGEGMPADVYADCRKE
jgi:legumain